MFLTNLRVFALSQSGAKSEKGMESLCFRDSVFREFRFFCWVGGGDLRFIGTNCELQKMLYLAVAAASFFIGNRLDFSGQSLRQRDGIRPFVGCS
jgi:hypothetical protein